MKNPLLTQVMEQTGLPQNALEKEVTRVLTAHGLTEENVGLEELRQVLADYLQEVFLEIGAEENSGPNQYSA